jgi:hypothetical protein
MVLFIRLIIRTFQLVFSAKTVFFSHSKSANSVFQPLISTNDRLIRFVRTHEFSDMMRVAS